MRREEEKIMEYLKERSGKERAKDVRKAGVCGNYVCPARSVGRGNWEKKGKKGDEQPSNFKGKILN